jgi:hypothetical protein
VPTPLQLLPSVPLQGRKEQEAPKGLALLGDLSTLGFPVPGRNWRKSREGRQAGKRSAPPPATCLRTPETRVLQNRLPRVRAKADVFQQGTAPSHAPPRPPPCPSPCNVCGACLQRQRVPHTVLGAPPTIVLQRSPMRFRNSHSRPQTQHPPIQFPHFLFSPLPGSFRLLYSLREYSCRAGWAGDLDCLLTRVSTCRVRTGLSVSGSASAQHTAPLSSSSSSRSGRSEGRRVMTGPGQGPGNEDRLLG